MIRGSFIRIRGRRCLGSGCAESVGVLERVRSGGEGGSLHG